MKLIKIIIAIIIVVVIGIAGWMIYSGKFQFFNSKTKNTVGAVSISDISPTEKLKVLTVYKEICVNQVKDSQGLFSSITKSKDQICAIYPARLDLGFDLSKCDTNWIQVVNDSTFVTLPPVEVLNKDNECIDETNMRVPIEKGEWSAKEKNALRVTANKMMLEQCRQEKCYELAEEQGLVVVKQFIETLGKENVRVQINHKTL